MSYCWRLQYYCKLGAAHGAGPIYYVSRLPQQAHQPVRESVEFQPFPGRARGHTQGLALTSHGATGRRDGKPPAQAGQEHRLGPCAGRSVAGSWWLGPQAGGGGSWVTTGCDTPSPTICSTPTGGPGVVAGGLCPASLLRHDLTSKVLAVPATVWLGFRFGVSPREGWRLGPAEVLSVSHLPVQRLTRDAGCI